MIPLENNNLINLNDRFSLSHVETRVFSISFLALSLLTFIAGIGGIICSVILSQPLFLLCSLLAVALFSLTLGIFLHSLKKYYIPKIPLNNVKNFSIKEKTPSSITIEVYSDTTPSKTITFVSQSPEHMLKSNVFYDQRDSYASLTGYVCTTNQTGSPDFSPEGQTFYNEFFLAWKKAQKEGSFSLGEVRTSPLFLSKTLSSYHTNEHNILTDIYTRHLHVLLCFSHTRRSSPSSLYKELKTSYKNIFSSAKNKNIETLYLPVLGNNASVLESKNTIYYRNEITTKTLLQCLFEEISQESSLSQYIIFTDKNSIIEEILWEKAAKPIE